MARAVKGGRDALGSWAQESDKNSGIHPSTLVEKGSLIRK